MKTQIIITKLFLSGLTVAASLVIGNQAFATSTQPTTPDKIITEASQKLSQLKVDKQYFSDKKSEQTIQLSNLEQKMKKIQISLEQLEEIESVTAISETTKSTKDQNVTLTTTFSPVPIQNSPIVEKKEQLTELKQQQALLKTTTEDIAKKQDEMVKQESQLTEKITQAKKQKEEQVKKTDARSMVINSAKTHLGKPYVYGAAGPDSFDCSGLVQVAFAAAGHALGRTTLDQESAGTTISVAEAQAGDLVFWGSHGGTYHVGISTGDGSYIHAPVPGDVVQIATVASYAPDFAVRVL